MSPAARPSSTALPAGWDEGSAAETGGRGVSCQSKGTRGQLPKQQDKGLAAKAGGWGCCLRPFHCKPFQGLGNAYVSKASPLSAVTRAQPFHVLFLYYVFSVALVTARSGSFSIQGAGLPVCQAENVGFASLGLALPFAAAGLLPEQTRAHSPGPSRAAHPHGQAECPRGMDGQQHRRAGVRRKAIARVWE